MSAYVVSKKHIDLLVSVAVNGTRDGIVPPSIRNPDELGQLLVSENVASVSYRYPDDDASKGELPGPCDAYYNAPYQYRDPVYQLSAAELYAAIRCYEYQSCEHFFWQGSEAKRLCDQACRIIEAKIPEAKKYRESRGSYHVHPWPEMDAAPWGWEEITVALRYAANDPEGVTFLWALRVQRTDAAALAALSDWLMGRGVIEEALTLDDMPHDLPKLPPMSESFKAGINRGPAPNMPTSGVYVQYWSGSQNGVITDMSNAGKRGKKCRQLSFRGDVATVADYLATPAEERAARGGCYALNDHTPIHEARPDDFDTLCAELRKVAEAGAEFTTREVRGIDAPRPELRAGIPGEWSARCDEHGVSITRLDDVNEWTEITGSRQAKAEAYRIASKVWGRVQLASTFREASDILTAAGCKFHGFCGVD